MWREAAKVFANTGNWIEFGSRVQRQHWSRGQCNIVDHRKLVSLINNDKKTNRGGSIVGYLGAGQWHEEVGAFPTAEHGSPEGPEGSGHVRSQHEEGKKRKPGPLFLCSCTQVFFCNARWTQGVTAAPKQHPAPSASNHRPGRCVNSRPWADRSHRIDVKWCKLHSSCMARIS